MRLQLYVVKAMEVICVSHVTNNAILKLTAKIDYKPRRIRT